MSAAFSLCVFAQAPTETPTQASPTGQMTSNTTVENLKPNYVLGPGDQIIIHAFEVEELGSRPFRIDGDGFVNLPLIGRLEAGGKTVEQFERMLTDALKKYVRQPQVSVTVTQFRSEPVFFVGAFKSPGIYPLQGQRTLVEMLSSVGGLLPNASRRIKVTRRKEFGVIPLPNAQESADEKTTSAIIGLGSLRENVNPAEDILLKPFDVVSVERSEMIFVNGEVGRVGGLELNERESLSVVQALSFSGGMTRDADPKKAKVLRPVLNSPQRAEIPLNVAQIMNGEAPDFRLLPNDLLYIPKASSWKHNIGRSLIIGIPIIVSVVVLSTRI